MIATWLDLVLLAIAGVMTLVGLFRGLVRELVGTVAVLAGFILAAHYYPNLAPAFSGVIEQRQTRDFLSFGIIFLALVLAGAFFGRFISRQLAGTSRFFNHLFGGALGFIKGAFICGAMVLGLAVFTSSKNLLSKSRLSDPALRLTREMIRATPQELKTEFLESYRKVLKIRGGGRWTKKLTR